MIIVVSHPDDDHADRGARRARSAAAPATWWTPGCSPRARALTQHVTGRRAALRARRGRRGAGPRRFVSAGGGGRGLHGARRHGAGRGRLHVHRMPRGRSPGMGRPRSHLGQSARRSTRSPITSPTSSRSRPRSDCRSRGPSSPTIRPRPPVQRANGPGRTIYKTSWPPRSTGARPGSCRPTSLALLDRVRLAPVIFQEFVPAVADIRVTVIGERLFATAITTAPGSTPIDYRMDLWRARRSDRTRCPGDGRRSCSR